MPGRGGISARGNPKEAGRHLQRGTLCSLQPLWTWSCDTRLRGTSALSGMKALGFSAGFSHCAPSWSHGQCRMSLLHFRCRNLPGPSENGLLRISLTGFLLVPRSAAQRSSAPPLSLQCYQLKANLVRTFAPELQRTRVQADNRRTPPAYRNATQLPFEPVLLECASRSIERMCRVPSHGTQASVFIGDRRLCYRNSMRSSLNLK
jgi:hypothetical protein